MEQTYCIYKITNKINGKGYIGFTKNFGNRMKGHLYTANKGVGQAIHAAIRKYGWDNFSKEELYCSTNKQHTLDMEDVFINIHETKGIKGYNVRRGGQSGPPKGKWSAESRAKNSASKMGHSVSATTREKLRLANKGKYFGHNRGNSKIMSREVIEKARQANLGSAHSQEHKTKISSSMLGRRCSEETRKRMSAAQKGRIKSQEQRKKLSDAISKLWQCNEYRQHMIVAHKEELK